MPTPNPALCFGSIDPSAEPFIRPVLAALRVQSVYDGQEVPNGQSPTLNGHSEDQQIHPHNAGLIRCAVAEYLLRHQEPEENATFAMWLARNLDGLEH